MRKSKFNATDHIAEFNNIKRAMQATGRPFSKKEIIKALKNCGFPSSSTFWSVFRNSGLIKDVSRGFYEFTTKEPIHAEALAKVHRDYLSLGHVYNNKKPSVEKEKATEPENLPKDDPKAMTQFAIDLLKEQGYQIFAPVGMIYSQV